MTLQQTLASLPYSYQGPGGAVAILRNGEVLEKYSWGWANAERRIPFTPSSLFRMCSITKQFTCALVLDAFPDPTILNADISARLPRLERAAPNALQLCHNQSGLRDYWAVAMLHGSPAEAPFGDTEAARVIAGTRSLQFEPGTRFSYVNQNFRLLSDILQARTGRGFAELLHARIFDRAGMHSAILAADTRAMPDGTEGYEGTQATGFRAAENRILWTGDAGLGASLEDMIAWERHIDATRNDPAALYSRLSAPVQFADGKPASYGFGLSRATEYGRAVTGHGGGLRGWSSYRLNVPAERISIVVLFNHHAKARNAAMDLLSAVLGETAPEPVERRPAPPWLGVYIEPETGIATRIDTDATGKIRLRFGHFPEPLDLRADGTADDGEGTCLRLANNALWMDRPDENQSSLLQPANGSPTKDIAGGYHCSELDAALTITDAGGVLYGGFSGFLGQGRMELLEPVGTDLWALPCPRALDHTPPGDWTLAVQRGTDGKPQAIRLGCWLARNLLYTRV